MRPRCPHAWNSLAAFRASTQLLGALKSHPFLRSVVQGPLRVAELLESKPALVKVGPKPRVA